MEVRALGVWCALALSVVSSVEAAREGWIEGAPE